ncbi:hypothetical protein BHU72_12365 [Desulfuribacillus stibiiarsenatis]|uniref:histidine kinase n=1 Tax=Desulfuribacillus stibiiarsenatis TaxID=1390249 RepID=A0A1E5L2C2_9FIRM|nr:ATP-binding protein [Desulfuribacillus stibiiarsenatis]OEH84191.1 hypothetical protein BHU72_12365 [Desulfuribacillus stibiiarsenatis]
MMGFAITLQAKNFSTIPLAKSLKYLALFGIVHGLVEWGHFFIPMLENHPDAKTLHVMYQFTFKVFITALSYFFLFLFGSTLYVETKKKSIEITPMDSTNSIKIRTVFFIIRYAPYVMFSLWLFFFIITRLFLFTDVNEWRTVSNTWSRYLLCLPGSILAGYALYLQVPDLLKNQLEKTIPLVKRLGVVFYLYAIVAGVVVPETFFFPSNIINVKSFFEVTGIPVQIMRALCGVLMAYYSVQILKIFSHEMHIRVETAERINAIHEERNRFSRDLHDGIIQSVYGVGLYIENVPSQIDKDPEKAKEHIHVAIDRLNGVIKKIRQYINDLREHPEYNQSHLLSSILEMIHDFKEYSNIMLQFQYDKELEYTNISVEKQKEFQLVIFELLTNVIKHANATQVSLEIQISNNTLCLRIEDNGIGYSLSELQDQMNINGHKQGLKNVKERVALLRGSIDIDAKINEGTKITIIIPIGDVS